MPRYAQIDENGNCIGVSDLAGEVDAPHMILIGPEDFPSGQRWTGSGWEDLPAAPPPLSPITPRQMLIGLLSIGITEAMVLAELEAIADPQERAIALIEWQRAGAIDRNHPLVDELAATFELPPEQVDDLWRWAAGL
jgi:hypothetical protein